MTDEIVRLAAQLEAAVSKGLRLEAILAKLLVRDTVMAAIHRHGGDASKLLQIHVAQAVQVHDMDAAEPRFVVVDPESGKERPGVTVDDLVCEFRRSSDFVRCFESPPDGGKDSSRRLANNPWEPGATFNVTEQARLLRANPALAARLTQEAKCYR